MVMTADVPRLLNPPPEIAGKLQGSSTAADDQKPRRCGTQTRIDQIAQLDKIFNRFDGKNLITRQRYRHL